MTYQKLCQLYADDSTGTNAQGQEVFPGTPIVYYLEDCNGNVITNNIPSFPLSVKCEIITFNNQSNFLSANKPAISSTTAIVSASASPVRANVYAQLTATYPNLVE